MHRTLVFNSTWNNEWQYDSDENPITPGAKELAEEIVNELKKTLSYVSEISQHGFHGWSFSSKFEDAIFKQVMNPVDEVYLTISMESYYRKLLLFQRPKSLFDEYCELLKIKISELRDISNFRWVQ